MVNHDDPRTWNKKHAVQNRKECLFCLQETNMAVVDFIKEKKPTAAIIGLDRLMSGLALMSERKDFGDVMPYLSAISCVKGEVMAFTSLEDLVREAENYNDKSPQERAEGLRKEYQKDAITALEDARDYSRSSEVKDYVTPIISALKAGAPPRQVQQQYAPEYPWDLPDVLLEIDLHYFIPEINKCVSTDLSASRSKPASSGGASSRPTRPASDARAPAKGKGGGRRFKGKAENFDEWMEMNELSEEDLEWIYKRVKLRRNIYGVLSFCTPLGIGLLPFWFVAVQFTKIIRTRDLDAQPNFLCKVIFGLYSLGLLLLPIPFVWFIGWSKWGMGLGTRASQVMNTLFWGGILLMILWQMASSIGPIPFIAGGGLLIVFLVVRWCRRIGSIVPALAVGGLAAAALVVFLMFFRMPVMTGESGQAGLPNWLTSLPGRAAGIFRKEEGTSAGSAAEDQGLTGSWYSAALYAPADYLEPNALNLRYYAFQEDGTCRTESRYYTVGGEDLEVYQQLWHLEDVYSASETYTVDERNMLLSIRPENAQTSGDSQTCRYELRDGVLTMDYDGWTTAYFRADGGEDDLERLAVQLFDQAQGIAGSWSTAWREGNSIWMNTYTFRIDGTFIVSPLGFDHSVYTQFPGETGWYVMPMGHPASYGTFVFDGETLVLTYLGSDEVPQEEWAVYTEVLTAGGDLSSGMELDGRLYVFNDGLDDKTVWSMLGVDYSVR